MKIILNEQTKPYVKRYYINRYLNNIECNDLDIREHRENIEKLVDDTINGFLKGENNLSFSKKINNAYQNYIYKYKIKRLGLRDIFLLAKSNSKYIKNLYNYYENQILYNIYNSIEYIGDEKVCEAKKLLKSYFDDIDITKINSLENFYVLLGSWLERMYSKLEIKTKSAPVRNEQIAVKEGSLIAKENAKKHFKTLYLKKIDEYESLLTKEKLKIYIESVIDKLIENYFNNKPSYSLTNYLSPRLGKILKELNKDIVLIKYARMVNNDDYNYAIDYYLKKYEYILDDYDKNDGLIERYKELVEKYVRSEYLRGIESYLKPRLNEFVKENTHKSINFNLDLARGSNEIERQRQRHILLTEFEYKIDLYKKVYKFYDSEKIVDKKLKEIYIDTIDSYINGISNSPTNRYLSTLLKQRFESYSKKTKDNIYTYLLNFVIIEKDYFEVLEEYYNEHTLTYAEKGNLEEYMGLILDEYIENGCYEDAHKEYFRKMIENYENIDKSYVYKK